MTGEFKTTLIVIPAYNEEASVHQVIEDVKTAVPTAEVLVVDDGSSDATSEKARTAQSLVATLPFNLGVGGAMRTGYRYALEHGFDRVVQIDADGQHDPFAIPMLLDELDHADIVIGARFAGAGDYRVRGPRAWAMKLFAVVLSRAARTKLTDTTSGFRATGPAAVRLFATDYPAEYLGDTLEALVIAIRSGLTIRQVPVSMRPRASGVPSHGPLRSALYLGRAIIALVFAFGRKPTSPRGTR